MHSKHYFALLSLAILLAVVVCGPALGAWTTPQLLNDPSEISTKNGEIYASKYGGFHAVYANAADPWQVVYRRYYNGYLYPRVIVRTGFVPNTNLCEAGNGDIHLVWEDWDGNLEVGWAKSTNGGQSFTWQEITNTGDTKWPLLAPYGPADSPNVLMTYWEAEEKNLYWRTYDGSSWGPLTNMNQNADNQYEVFGICRSLQDGTIYRSYGTKVGGVLSVCFRRFNGSYWEPQVVVASPGFFCRHAIAVNTTGHILVMWEQDERVWTRMYTPGIGWGPIEQRTNESSGYGDITAIPGTTDFYLVYRRAEQIWGRRWQGGVWQAEERVSVGRPNAFVVDADVTAGPDGTLYASWEDWSTGNPQQYFSIFPGAGSTDATVQGYVRDQYGQGIPNASVASGPYVTVSGAGGWYSMGVPSGTRSFTATKAGYTGQTIEGVVIPPNGTINLNFTITSLPLPPPSGFVAMPSDRVIRVSWTNPSESWFQGTMVRYKTTGYPTGPNDGILLCDRQGPAGSTDVFTHSNLTNGQTYYYAAFAHDSDNHYSAAAYASAKPAPNTCASVRQLPNEWIIDLYSRVVTADFAYTDGCIYIMDPGGASGLRVATTQLGLAPGDRVNVTGKVRTRMINGYPSERVIEEATVTKVSSGPAPEPVAMKCRSVGGGPAGPMVPGVKNGVGLNNMGLLVRIVGKITYKAGDYLYVDDGSNVENLYGISTPKTGVMVKCPGWTSEYNQGDIVGVTGIVEGSIPNNPAWTTNRAMVHIRGWEDLTGFRVVPTTGTISGVVTAQGGGGISGATVSTSTGGYSTTTNADGSYALSKVAPGTYTVTASKTGYLSASQSNVVVQVGQTTTVNLVMTPNMGTISGTVTASGGGGISGATVTTSPGGYSTTTGSGGSYTLSNVPAGTYSLTASKSGYQSQTQSGVQVNANQTTTVNFTLSPVPVERVVNGNMEGGFYNTGWGTDCSGRTSQLPNPSGNSGWGWNNVPGVPFNAWDSTGVKHGGSHALGFSFCQTAASPGKIGVAFQSVNLGVAGAVATFSAWGYHTDGNCPTIMCWNPGPGQADPLVALNNGRYQWITTDNWGQRNMWVNRSMTVTADSSGYVTIMVGGAAHPGTATGAALYIDDVSVMY
ncbi:MAG: carboxypeptidase-like regulatory domain-containing protein [Armatimonadota bacterium]